MQFEATALDYALASLTAVRLHTFRSTANYGTVRAAGRPGAGGAASREPLFNAAHPARHVESAAHSCVEPRAMIL